MAAFTERTNRAARAVILSVVTFLVMSGTALAADHRKKSSVKKTTTSQASSRTQLPSRKKYVQPQPLSITAEAALAAFDTFTIEWMQKLAQTESFQKSRAQVVESPEGFAAEYVGYIPERKINVKKTDSSDTPYVGILTYSEKRLRCAGKTKEAALQGPFEQVDTSQVSEIFRFTKGKWVY